MDKEGNDSKVTERAVGTLRAGLEMVRFVRLVADMRDAQKGYYARRTRSWLVRARDLERAVDARLLELVHGYFQAPLAPLDPPTSGGTGDGCVLREVRRWDDGLYSLRYPGI